MCVVVVFSTKGKNNAQKIAYKIKKVEKCLKESYFNIVICFKLERQYTNCE